MSLESFFRSNTLYKILNLLTSNKERSFFIREISRKIKADPAIVYRELVRLEKEDIVLSETKGRSKYFKINQEGVDYKKITLIFKNKKNNSSKKFIISYGEPSVTPLTLSVNLSAFPRLRVKDKRFIKKDMGDTICLFRGNDMQFGVEMDKAKKVSYEINKNLPKRKFVEDNKKSMEELSARIINSIKELSNFKEVNKRFVIKLDKLFNQGVELCQLGYVGSFADFPGNLLSKKMKQIACERIKKESREITDQQAINTLSAPPNLSLTAKRELELLKLSKKFLTNKKNKTKTPEKLQKELFNYYINFHWTDFGHIGPKKDFEQINKEIFDVLEKYNKSKIEKRIKEIKEYENEIDKKRTGLAKELKITEEEFNVFYSAGVLSYLKGLRQELLSGINCQIQTLVGNLKTKHKIEEKYLYQASFDELLEIFYNGPKNNIENKLKGRDKMAIWILEEKFREQEILSGQEAKDFFQKRVEEEKNEIDQKESFHGMAAYLGKIRGQVIIVNSDSDLDKVKKGNVLVAKQTMPTMVPAMKRAAGFLTDIGGITCHAAIMSREMKKPCIVGTKIATKILKDGDFVELDADKGIVKIIKLN